MVSIVRMDKEENPASIAEADRRGIALFIERVWSEDGLAERTLEAYRRDLEALARWLASRGRSLRTATREDISAYHGTQAVAVRSIARRQSTISSAWLSARLTDHSSGITGWARPPSSVWTGTPSFLPSASWIA